LTVGGKPDREFDALPVDNMEPSSDPVNMRPGPDGGLPGLLDAWRALYAYPYSDLRPEHKRELPASKQHAIEEHGDGYPAWILDRMGVEIMLANRVAMGRGIAPPRFRWVPYVDALLFPLDNSQLAARNSDRKAFFADEDILRRRYLDEAGLSAPPATLDVYLTQVVTPTLERQKQAGAVAEKFEAAYLRSLAFDAVDRPAAERVYAQYRAGGMPADDQYKLLQDYIFRYIAAECGRLGMAVHIHTMAGAGSYFDVRGANPLLLESVLNDPALRKTKFVMLHGGWPFTSEITALLTKPNAYLDYSQQSLLLTPATMAVTLRQWLEYVPEKVLFATDAYPYSEDMGWEESGVIAAQRGRQALALALEAMMRDGEISHQRAIELANMVLRDNARALYGL
jgi:predicted TIM-barrel fold metal-dependent hydrolase